MAGTAAASGAVGFDVRGQRAQRGEDAAVFLAVRAQLEAVALAHGQRQLQRVDRIQAQAGVEQRRLGIDGARIDLVEIQGLDQEFGEFTFGGGLAGHAAATVAAIILGPDDRMATALREMQTPAEDPSSRLPAADCDAPRLQVDYVDAATPSALLAGDDVLAAFGFGTDAPPALADPRYLRVPLEPYGP